MRMVQIWRNLIHLLDRLIPRYQIVENSNESLIHRYYQFLCAVIFSFFVVFCANSFYLGIYKLAAGQATILLIIAASVLVYRKTHSLTLAASIILGFSAPVTFYRVYVLGGLQSPILFGWPVISVLAMMTLPSVWAFLWTSVHVAFAGYFYLAMVQGVIFPVQAPEGTVANVRIAMICASQVILFCSIYVIRKLNIQLREKLRDQSEKVTNVVRTLSHDLSSPMMTLSFWIRSAAKLSPARQSSWDGMLSTLSRCSTLLSEIREIEARHSGKTGEHVERTSEEDLAQTVFSFAALLLSGLFASLAALYAFEQNFAVTVLQLIVVISSVVGFAAYHKSGSILVAASIVLGAGLVSIGAQAYLLGGIAAPVFFISPIFMVFAALFLPLRQASVWVSLYLVVAIVFDAGNRTGFLPASFEAAGIHHLHIRIASLILLQMIIVAAVYFLQQQNRRFSRTIESQHSKRVNLLRTLTVDVGEPLRSVAEKLKSAPESDASRNALRAAEACVGLSEHVAREPELLNTMQLTGVDLRDVVQDVGFLQNEALEAKGIRWSTALPEQPLWVAADRTGLTYQVLNNLISNAIKFTDKGGRITLGIQEAPKCWEIVVQDTGIGIPKELLAKLFDPQKQTTRLGTNGEKGTGFGMPIVKQIVEGFGGQIQVESKTLEKDHKNHGTRITIFLPKLAPKIAVAS